MQTPFYKPFHIRDFGMNTREFLEHLQPIYETLECDQHDVLRGGLAHPTRKRAVAESLIQIVGDTWTTTPLQPQPYVQPTSHGGYDRRTPRAYPQPPENTTTHPEFIRLQKSLAELVGSIREGVHSLRLIFTFLRTVVDDTRSGICALEGEPHSDGMPYIVSGLVIQRRNLAPDSGVSSVHRLNGEKIYEAALQPGEGIFQDDINLLHHITNIRRIDVAKPGIRDMLGIDLVINPQ